MTLLLELVARVPTLDVCQCTSCYNGDLMIHNIGQTGKGKRQLSSKKTEESTMTQLHEITWFTHIIKSRDFGGQYCPSSQKKMKV